MRIGASVCSVLHKDPTLDGANLVRLACFQHLDTDVVHGYRDPPRSRAGCGCTASPDAYRPQAKTHRRLLFHIRICHCQPEFRSISSIMSRLTSLLTCGVSDRSTAIGIDPSPNASLKSNFLGGETLHRMFEHTAGNLGHTFDERAAVSARPSSVSSSRITRRSSVLRTRSSSPRLSATA